MQRPTPPPKDNWDRGASLVERAAKHLGLPSGPAPANGVVHRAPKSPPRAVGPPSGHEAVDNPVPENTGGRSVVSVRNASKLLARTQSGRVAEEIRLLKRSVLTQMRRDSPDLRHTAMITSARPHEGKSFVSFGLAASLAAESDLTVYLLDFDFYRGSLTSDLGLSAAKGLTDILAGNCLDPVTTYVETDIENLRIVPSGYRPSGSRDLLTTRSLNRALQILPDTTGGIVTLLDMPPVLATSESATIAGMVDALILVVEAGKTKRAEISESIALTQACPNLTIVLNKVTSEFGSGGFGRYRQYYAQDSSDSTDRLEH